MLDDCLILAISENNNRRNFSPAELEREVTNPGYWNLAAEAILPRASQQQVEVNQIWKMLQVARDLA